MNDKINLSITQFEDLFPEWTEYEIQLKDDLFHILDMDGEKVPYEDSNAKEMLSNFSFVLKKNSLMITRLSDTLFKIVPYRYVFDDSLEVLADSIENEVGNHITNLVVRQESNTLKIKYNYLNNPNNGEKQQIKGKIKNIIERLGLNI